MDKFFEQFKDNLENQALPEYDARDWEDMKQRLEVNASQPSSSTRFGKYWMVAASVAALFIVGLAASQFFLYQEVKKATHKITELEQQLEQKPSGDATFNIKTIESTTKKENIEQQIQNTKQSSNSNQVESNDSKKTLSTEKTTTFNQQQNITTKTVTKTIESDSKDASSNNQLSIRDKTSIDITNNKAITAATTKKSSAKTNTIQKPILNNIMQSIPTQSNTKVASNELINTSNLQFLAALPFESKADLSFINLHPTTKTNTQEDTKQNTLLMNLLKPEGAELGVHAGLFHTEKRGFRNFEGFSRGGQLKVIFTSGLRLWLSGDFRTFSYSTRNMEERLGVPPVPPPSDDFLFEEAFVNRSIWSADIGLKYAFFRNSDWQPYLGIGVGTSGILNNDTDYRFRNPLTNELRTIEPPAPISLYEDYAIYKAGLAYWVTRKLTIQVEGSYREHFDKTSGLPNVLNGQIGLFYMF